MISIKLTNDSINFLSQNRKLPNEITINFRQIAYKAGRTLLTWLKQDMKNPKSGRKYKSYFGVGGKYKTFKFITASAPTETPAIRTGNFRKSVDFNVIGNTKLEWGSGKGYATEYARALEFGTKRMKARQPLQRAMQANDKSIQAMSIAQIQKTLRNAR